MQLKLRVGLGDTLTIDVQPTDTFQDLSDRLYSLGGVKVDLSQLQKSNDKPFDMSTNVINYFLPSEKEENPEENGKPKRLCRLCCQTIASHAHFLFEDKKTGKPGDVTLVEKVNASLPIHVTMHDNLPKQICDSCHLKVNRGFEFMKKVVEAQSILEQRYKVKAKSRPVTNFKEEECCPLCQAGHLKHVDYRLMHVNGPNQGEKVLRKEVVIQVPKGNNAAGAKRDVPVPYQTAPVEIKQEPIDADYYDEDVVTGYWGDSSQDVDPYGNKRTKKRSRHEDDQDWTIDEEYVPVSRRGRPRGTKNKPKVPVMVIEKACALCGWIGADVDMYAHAINQHCQPDMGYFPCPLCKTNQPNEMHLETHLDRHVAQARKDKST